MKQFTQHELDAKIQGFMARKMTKFPELETKQRYSEQEKTALRSKFKRLYASPFLQLDAQF